MIRSGFWRDRQSLRLARIVFAVLVPDEKLPGNDTIMLATGRTVLLSVIAHGVTANPLVKRMAGRSAELAA
jgi:sodium/hydrogen antiporter